MVIVAALFILVLGTANAESAGRGHRDIDMMDHSQVYYGTGLSTNPSLDLTAQQAAQLRALDEKYEQEMKPIQAQLYSKRNVLMSEWLQVIPDEGKIIVLQRDVRNLRNLMREKMTNHRTNVINILTPKQQRKVQTNWPDRGFLKQRGFGQQ